MSINIGTLIVVTQQDDILAEFFAGHTNSFAGILVSKLIKTIEGNGCSLHSPAQQVRPLEWQ
jgi:hypothetical protein